MICKKIKKERGVGGERENGESHIMPNCIWSLISSPINEEVLVPMLKFYSLLINIMWNFRWIS